MPSVTQLKIGKHMTGIVGLKESLEEVAGKVLGSGCPNCDRLEQELMMIIGQMGIEADLEHVRDIKEISRYGVMGVPALLKNQFIYR